MISFFGGGGHVKVIRSGTCSIIIIIIIMSDLLQPGETEPPVLPIIITLHLYSIVEVQLSAAHCVRPQMHKYQSALTREHRLMDCEIFSKKTPQPKHCRGVQKIQDLETAENSECD